MRRWTFRRRLLLGALAVLCGACGSSPVAPDGAPGDRPDDVLPQPECPASWTAPDGSVIDFTGPIPTPAATTLPFAAFVQDTDGVRGVPNSGFAAMISRRFSSGRLVVLGKKEDEGQASYLASLGELVAGVEIDLTLDATDPSYQSVAGQLAGLTVFKNAVESASGGARSIARLVYQKDGGKLTDDELVELSGKMPAGVDLAVFGSIGGATPVPPPGWLGSYGVLVETYGLFSHDCDQPNLPVLVDGPAGGASICGDTCVCTPAGTNSIYELCAGAPAQAGRIAAYLASLKAVPESGSLTGVEFIFSFEPSSDDPTIAPAAWDPVEYAEFAQAFAETLRVRTGADAGVIALGTWDMTADYAATNGW